MFRWLWSRSRQIGQNRESSINTVSGWSPPVFLDHGIWHVPTMDSSEAVLILENEITQEK
jgi:hypothetical protein